MILEWFVSNGPWAWMGLGFTLLALELAIPGVFLMWVGLAAVAVGAVGLLGLPSSILGLPVGGWDWQAQAVTFAALAVLFAVMGGRMTARRDNDEADDLGRPGRRLLGRTGTLVDPIEGGIGRVKLGDTLWRVEGSDMPAGTRVTVTGENGATLSVKAAEVPVLDRTVEQ